MTGLTNGTDGTLAKLRELRKAQLALVWPAVEQAAASSGHAPLVERIKLYTAIQAIDFAIANRPDSNAPPAFLSASARQPTTRAEPTFTR